MGLFKKKNKNFCKNCNSPLEPNAVFCVECGAKQTPDIKPAEVKPEKKMVCSNCGSAVIPGSLFCMGCGAVLQAPPAPQVPNEVIQNSVCSNCGSKVEAGSLFCMTCGNAVAPAPAAEKADNFWQPGPPSSHSESPSDVQTYEEYDDDEGDESTCLLGEDDGSEATTLLSEPKVFPKLIRKSNGEEIIIGKSVFKIGKERAQVDYCISGNKTVSRVHAEIVEKNDNYFIYDNNSTNKTFLNGNQIFPQKEFKLSDGDKLRFSDVEFEFRF